MAAEMDDFGGKLRQARERRGISLRQIASSTKIAAAALEALEKNDISKLPGGIFSRAFVRSYAVEVGLDPDETVKEFLDRFNQDPPPSAEAMAAAIPEEEKQFEQRQRQAVKALAFGGGPARRPDRDRVSSCCGATVRRPRRRARRRARRGRAPAPAPAATRRRRAGGRAAAAPTPALRSAPRRPPAQLTLEIAPGRPSAGCR